MKTCLLTAFLAFVLVAQAQPGNAPEDFVFNTQPTWRGERLPLPTGFAPDMQIKGVEDIRFAPGMFNPESDEFFTYVLAFSVNPEFPLTCEVVKREFLSYYRGLASAVSRNKPWDPDPAAFTMTLTESRSDHLPARATQAAAYHGTLDWVEPFRTGKAQTLNLEIVTWRYDDSARHYLFACVSPKPRDHAVWKKLRQIQKGFMVKPRKP